MTVQLIDRRLLTASEASEDISVQPGYREIVKVKGLRDRIDDSYVVRDSFFGGNLTKPVLISMALNDEHLIETPAIFTTLTAARECAGLVKVSK